MTAPVAHMMGLGSLLARLPWGGEVILGPLATVLGPAAHIGSGRALPSSAAPWSVITDRGEVAVWVAAPEVAADPKHGLAPIYLFSGQHVVLPTVRLFVDGSSTPEYLSQSHWLEDSLSRWRFETTDGSTQTIEERAAGLPAPAGLDLIAGAIRYALFGSARTVRRHGLILPPMPMWVRPTGEGAFARDVARTLVVTARLDLLKGEGAVPRGTVAGAHRVSPGNPRDRGLDPFHTPEGSEIRLTARLGVGVEITSGRTLATPTDHAPLDPSSTRLPFAGFNDPRRLLMAANMQVQAVDIESAELPIVTVDGERPDPPGVNLRIGYLAWGGWNHEDAWVLSESAAARLAAIETTIVVLERRALELDEPLLMRIGQHIRRGALLIERRYAPTLLTDDLATLVALPGLDEAIPVDPEVGDLAPEDGEVIAIDDWDLLVPRSLPPGWIVAEGLTARYRRVYRVTLRRRLTLSVGDKLANRHGHKGVVGFILPDAAMPRWQGKPLDALIDPISVLNRSNWGQLHEALKAGPDADRDAEGRSKVELPGGRMVRAVAGLQFVMRMPQHAVDKLSGAPAHEPEGSVRLRTQRIGEMDHWAIWAHGNPTSRGDRLSPPAERLASLLGGAGYRFELNDGAIVLTRWSLEGKPPDGLETIAPSTPGPLADLYERLDEDAADLRVLVFDPPVELPPALESPPSIIAWLPLIPASARPPRRTPDGSEEPHPLTVALRSLVRAVRRRDANASGVGYALRGLMDEAYATAVGRTAAGLDSSKSAWLRRGVLGHRMAPSGRAVVSPAGDLGLALDEIGLPPALAHTLFGPGLPIDLTALGAKVDGRTVWLKRDPVLHRWGLLLVRVRVVDGLTIRLPASLLGPLGADFDGDTVAVFAHLPGNSEPSDNCRPPALACDGDEKSGRAMFVPGKQYVYGLHLLRKDPARRAAIDGELPEGVKWPSGRSAKEELETWVRQAALQKIPSGAWWATVERHALAALASDPGMGLGLFAIDAIRSLEVVACGASKDLYGPGRFGERMAALLSGNGLTAYAAVGELDAVDDPIAGVMVAAKTAVGRFGGALRRLLYSLPRLTPELVRAAQTLTEQITQKALSVKAGDPPVSVGEFATELRRLLAGEGPPPEGGTALRAILAQPRMRAVWSELQAELGREVPAWLRWLRNPHELATILTASGSLTLSIDDLRTAALIRSCRGGD